MKMKMQTDKIFQQMIENDNLAVGRLSVNKTRPLNLKSSDSNEKERVKREQELDRDREELYRGTIQSER